MTADKDAEKEHLERLGLNPYDFTVLGPMAGSGSYPIPDKAHAIAAKSYAARFASPSERAVIKRKIKAKFPGLSPKQPSMIKAK